MSTPVRKRTRRRLAYRDEGAEVVEQKKQDLTSVQVKTAANKEVYLKRLKDNMGLLTKTAMDLGIHRRTPEKWRVEDPEFNERVLTILCSQRDFVAGKLIENINNGSAVAQMFYLRCKGRGREVPDDWVERHEVAGAADAPLRIEASVEVVRDEVSDPALLKALSIAMKAAPELFPNTDKDG
jgi:hypothetical protein